MSEEIVPIVIDLSPNGAMPKEIRTMDDFPELKIPEKMTQKQRKLIFGDLIADIYNQLIHVRDTTPIQGLPDKENIKRRSDEIFQEIKSAGNAHQLFQIASYEMRYLQTVIAELRQLASLQMSILTQNYTAMTLHSYDLVTDKFNLVDTETPYYTLRQLGIACARYLEQLERERDLALTTRDIAISKHATTKKRLLKVNRELQKATADRKIAEEKLNDALSNYNQALGDYEAMKRILFKEHQAHEAVADRYLTAHKAASLVIRVYTNQERLQREKGNSVWPAHAVMPTEESMRKQLSAALEEYTPLRLGEKTNSAKYYTAKMLASAIVQIEDVRVCSGKMKKTSLKQIAWFEVFQREGMTKEELLIGK